MLSLGKRSCSSTASTATELSRVEIRSKGQAKLRNRTELHSKGVAEQRKAWATLWQGKAWKSKGKARKSQEELRCAMAKRG